MIHRLVRSLAPEFKRLWPAVAFDGLLAGAGIGAVLGTGSSILMICDGGVTLTGFVVLPIMGATIGVQIGGTTGAFVGLVAATLLQLSVWSRIRTDVAAVVTTVAVLVLLIGAESLTFNRGGMWGETSLRDSAISVLSSYWTYALPGLAVVPMFLSVRCRARQYAARVMTA